MDLTQLPVVPAKRIMSAKEANSYLGKYVPEIEPNLTDACLIVDVDTNEPVIAYLPLDPGVVRSLRRAVLAVKSWGTTGRAGGFDGASRTFGMSPRKAMHGREACRVSKLAIEEPDAHATLVELTDELTRILKTIAPGVIEHDTGVLEQVEDEWRMKPGSLWTSGVINRSASLPYHRDGFNFDTWSAMPVIRRGIRGGALHVPEYGITVACRDGWCLFFPGYQLVHGVTPLTPAQEDGYRFSIVFYALKGMRDCFTYAVELAEGRKRRTEREEKLAKAVKGETDFNRFTKAAEKAVAKKRAEAGKQGDA